jgi:hypothetical protein
MKDGHIFLQAADDPNHPTLAEVVVEILMTRGASRADEPEEEGKVPWDDFMVECYFAMDPTCVLDPSVYFGSHRTAAMEQFLGRLNNRVPSRYDSFVFWMILYQYQVGEKTGFLEKIDAVHKQLMSKFGPKTKCLLFWVTFLSFVYHTTCIHMYSPRE